MRRGIVGLEQPAAVLRALFDSSEKLLVRGSSERVAVRVLLRYGIGSDSDKASFARRGILSAVFAVPVAVSIWSCLVESVTKSIVATVLSAFPSTVEFEGREYYCAVRMVVEGFIC